MRSNPVLILLRLLASALSLIWLYILACAYPRCVNVVVLGPQNAGKTTLLRQWERSLAGSGALAANSPYLSVPTVAFSTRVYLTNNITVKWTDVGGQKRFYPLWERLLARGDADLVIYVMDLSDSTMLEEARTQVQGLIEKTNAARIPLVILGNKVDILPASPRAGPLGGGALTAGQGRDLLRFRDVNFLIDFLGISIHNDQTFLQCPYGSTLDTETPPHPLPAAEPSRVQLFLPPLWASSVKASLPPSALPLAEIHNDLGIYVVSLFEGSHLTEIFSWVVGTPLAMPLTPNHATPCV